MIPAYSRLTSCFSSFPPSPLISIPFLQLKTFYLYTSYRLFHQILSVLLSEHLKSHDFSPPSLLPAWLKPPTTFAQIELLLTNFLIPAMTATVYLQPNSQSDHFKTKFRSSHFPTKKFPVSLRPAQNKSRSYLPTNRQPVYL